MPRKGAVITKTAILFVITVSLGFSQLKSGSSAADPNPPDAALAKPIDWGMFQARMFKAVEKRVKFTLQTSWIPGENRKGMFRYKMTAYPDMADSDSPEEIENFMNRVHDCQITLDLYDVEGFLLRALPVPFLFGVGEKARVRGLLANTASQMDANEYRQFVGNSNKSGSWSITWDCGTRQ